MAVAIEDWSRPAFVAGGGEALLFYLAFGALAAVRLPPTPSGLSLRVHPQGEARLWVETLIATGDVARVVRNAPDFAVLRGHRADPPDLGHLRDAESVLTALFDAGAAAVLDVEAQRWWTSATLRAELLGSVRPALRAHVSVRSSNGQVETRGLRKFGRPDLRLRHVPPSAEARAQGLCWAVVERLARGELPHPGDSLAGLRFEDGGDPAHPALSADWTEAFGERASTG
jgi:hypothetical protein